MSSTWLLACAPFVAFAVVMLIAMVLPRKHPRGHTGAIPCPYQGQLSQEELDAREAANVLKWRARMRVPSAEEKLAARQYSREANDRLDRWAKETQPENIYGKLLQRESDLDRYDDFVKRGFEGDK